MKVVDVAEAVKPPARIGSFTRSTPLECFVERHAAIRHAAMRILAPAIESRREYGSGSGDWANP